MPKPTFTTPSGVVLDWRHAATGPPEPCVFGDGPTVCRSPAAGVPCHKGCAEAWITAHATSTGHLARLLHTHTPAPERGR